MKTIEEITELKKETDWIVIEKGHLFSNWVEVQDAIADACQHICESTVKLDVIVKDERLGEFIM